MYKMSEYITSVEHQNELLQEKLEEAQIKCEQLESRIETLENNKYFFNMTITLPHTDCVHKYNVSVEDTVRDLDSAFFHISNACHSTMRIEIDLYYFVKGSQRIPLEIALLEIKDNKLMSFRTFNEDVNEHIGIDYNPIKQKMKELLENSRYDTKRII